MFTPRQFTVANHDHAARGYPTSHVDLATREPEAAGYAPPGAEQTRATPVTKRLEWRTPGVRSTVCRAGDVLAKGRDEFGLRGRAAYFTDHLLKPGPVLGIPLGSQ